MNLTTVHINRKNIEFERVLARAGKDVNLPPNVRIITCGRGVVILPDTDVTKPCTLHELNKALHTDLKAENSEPKYTMINLTSNNMGCCPINVAVQDNVLRFLDWMEDNDMLDGFSWEHGGLPTDKF